MTKKKTLSIFIFLCIFLSIPLTSCNQADTLLSIQEVEESGTEIPSAPEQRKLTICLGYKPASLYLYKASSQVEWDILQAIYDGPFDIVNGETIPVILESVPSIENGEIVMNTVEVQGGELILNAAGERVPLTTGITYFPSGCSSADCAVQWDGITPVTMDQAAISFQLKKDLLWSDGVPLTAMDSVYSYTLAANPATPSDKSNVEQLSSYAVVDSTTVQAVFLPGFIPQEPEAYFFLPLPQHNWDGYSAADIADADFANQTPLGWGAYQITEWDEDSILLTKNPNYFRSDEGLPYFDQLEFRFVSKEGDANIASLEFDYAPYEIFEYNWSPDGETIYTDQCDIADSTVDFSDQYDMMDYLLDYYMTSALQVNALPNSILQGLWLNPQRPEVAELQPVISQCLDRAYIDSKANYGMAFPTNSLFDISAKEDGYFPEAAAQMLDDMGWIDDDSNNDTARVAQNVASVADGTSLVLTLTVPDTPFYERESAAVQASLQDCGIHTEIETIPTWEFQAQDGPLASSDFDIIPFSQTISNGFPCTSLDEKWLAFVLPGIENVEQIQQLCENTGQIDKELQTRIEKALPLIPLFYQVDVSIARSDMCGFTPTVGTSSDLWNLEEFNYGEACSE